VREDRIAVIAALIVERPLCAECISSKSNIATGELPGYLHRIGRAFVIRDQIERCRACGTSTTVFSLARSAS
jgi:hypothetical protein